MITLLAAGSVLSASPLLADGDAQITRLAGENARLRRDVDDASSKLRREREASDITMAALRTELEELDLQAEQAVSRREALRKLVASRRAKLLRIHANSERLREPLLRACDVLSDHITRTSPFQRDARLARVTSVQDKVRARNLSVSAALEALKRVIDDELELAQTIQLSRHVITLEGRSYMVPVVALGAALIYWRLEDGRAGFVASTSSGWEAMQVHDPAHKEAIRSLYDGERSAGNREVLSLPLPAIPHGGAQD